MKTIFTKVAGIQDSLHHLEITPILKDDRGQSTIEFLTTFVFAAGIIFFIVRLSMIYTSGYLVHYATFMASRTYMVVDNNLQDPASSDAEALSEATKVFNSYRLNAFAPAALSNLQVNEPSYSGLNLYVGVRTSYSTAFPSPTMVGSGSSVNLVSESFLGREPTRSECISRICDSMQFSGGQCQRYVTFYDNGC